MRIVLERTGDKPFGEALKEMGLASKIMLLEGAYVRLQRVTRPR